MNDLGLYDQALSTTNQGNFMYNSTFAAAEGLTKPSMFAKHAFYTLILLLPVYSLYSSPFVLLIIQAMFVALGAIPLYWLGKKLFKKKGWWTLVVPTTYLLNPMVHDANLYDFHLIVIVMPLLLFAFYFLYEKRFKLFYVLAAIIALSKEDMPLIIFMFGLYMIFVQKEKIRGFVVSALSLIYFIAVLKLFIPYFSGGVESIFISQRYGYLGGSIIGIVKNLLINPCLYIQSLLSVKKLIYIIFLLFPVVFLPLLTLNVFLLASPSLLINLLSSYTSMHVPFHYYYSAPILPFLFLATLFSLKKLYQKRVGILKYDRLLAFKFMLVTSVATSVFLSPTPYSLSSSWKEFQVSDHAKKIEKVKKLIPQDASVSVQINLGPHISQRLKVYSFPYLAEDADYVFLDIYDPNPVIRNFPSLRSFAFMFNFKLQDYYDNVVSVFRDNNYGVKYYSQDGYLIFERGIMRDKNNEAFKMFNENAKAVFSRYEDEIRFVADYSQLN